MNWNYFDTLSVLYLLWKFESNINTGTDNDRGAPLVTQSLCRLQGVSISESISSMAGLVSYRVGAWRMTPAVPTEMR